MRYTRRDVLRGAAGVAAGSVAVGTVAAQGEYEHWQAQPDHVSLAYDEPTLVSYAPRLELSQEAREKFRGLWGWTATSQEYDLDHHVYVAIYDAYHWVAGRQTASSITMDGEHPVASVQDPWHFFAHGGVDADAATSFDEVEDLTEEFGGLLSNGLDESLEPGTVTDPATMQARNHWWRSAVSDFSSDALLASAVYQLGWVGADQADSSALAF